MGRGADDVLYSDDERIVIVLMGREIRYESVCGSVCREIEREEEGGEEGKEEIGGE
jgi:hypothetical protein